MEEDEIQNAALSKSLKVVGLGGGGSKQKSQKSPDKESDQGGPKKKEVKNNDWIPTQAVRAILQIRDKFEG